MNKDVKGLTCSAWNREDIDYEAYDYGLITMISEIKLDSASVLENENIKLDDVLEARLFNYSEELHIWREDGNLVGCQIFVDETADTISLDNITVSSAISNMMITGRKILDYDEDGQAYVVCTKLDRIIAREDN